MKQLVKNILSNFNINVSQNQRYDKLTAEILKKVLNEKSNCLDVGCHKGDVLDLIIKQSPEGSHHGFEPIPKFYKQLADKFSPNKNVSIHNIALSDKKGEAPFNHVVNAPAYSGLKERKYDISNPKIENITVQTDLIDNLLKDEKVDLIKIDVEGGEFQVLKGGYNTIKKNKPYIIFECGLGASDFYGTRPGELFIFLTMSCGLKISLLQDFIDGKPPLTGEQFCENYNLQKEYYFLAHPAVSILK